MFDKFQEYQNKLQGDGKSKHTVKSYVKAIDSFVEYFNIQSCSDIEKIEKIEIVTFRSTFTIGKSSINTNMRAINVFLNWLVGFDYLSKNPMDGIKSLKESKKIKDVLTEEDVISMLDVCKNIQEKLMIAMMVTTGMRAGEVVALKFSDISDNRILINGKGDKQRVVGLQTWVIDILNQHIIETKEGEEVVFHSRKGGGKVSTTAIYLRVKRIKEFAGIEKNISPHSTRHFFATRLIEKGVSLPVVSKAMGHSDITTTMRYVHASNSAVDNAIGDVFGGFGG